MAQCMHRSLKTTTSTTVAARPRPVMRRAVAGSAIAAPGLLCQGCDCARGDRENAAPCRNAHGHARADRGGARTQAALLLVNPRGHDLEPDRNLPSQRRRGLAGRRRRRPGRAAGREVPAGAAAAWAARGPCVLARARSAARARARTYRRPCKPIIARSPAGMQAQHPHSTCKFWAGLRPGTQGGARTAAPGPPRV
jgi:hypothetical protein